jgi:hypothetical protein
VLNKRFMTKNIEPVEFTEDDVSALMSAIGAIGGRSRSAKKRKAVRENLKKARAAKMKIRKSIEPDDD